MKDEHGYGSVVSAFVASRGKPPVLVSHTRRLMRTLPRWLIEASTTRGMAILPEGSA